MAAKQQPLYKEMKTLTPQQCVFERAGPAFRVVRKMCEFEQHNHNSAFVHPVDTTKHPDYTKIVTTPMCLDDICCKFVELKYTSAEQVHADLKVNRQKRSLFS